ncbi:MAG: hypothetical protein ABDI19_04495 [Armatimonadota bacterium]
MSLRGVIRGRTIELEEDPHLPDGTTVEVELFQLPKTVNPFWGLLRDYADLLTEIEQEVMSERERSPWRPTDGKSAD